MRLIVREKSQLTDCTIIKASACGPTTTSAVIERVIKEHRCIIIVEQRQMVVEADLGLIARVCKTDIELIGIIINGYCNDGTPRVAAINAEYRTKGV